MSQENPIATATIKEWFGNPGDKEAINTLEALMELSSPQRKDQGILHAVVDGIRERLQQVGIEMPTPDLIYEVRITIAEKVIVDDEIQITADTGIEILEARANVLWFAGRAYYQTIMPSLRVTGCCDKQTYAIAKELERRRKQVL